MVAESPASGPFSPCNTDMAIEFESTSPRKITVTVEVVQRQTSAATPQEIARVVRNFLSQRSLLYRDNIVTWSSAEGQERVFLDSHVQEIRFCDTGLNSGIELGTRLMNWQVELEVHVFHLSEDGPADAEDADEEATPAYSEWQLPAQSFCGLWDSLIYEQGIKQKLLQYAATALHFGQQGVNPHLVAFNRTVLLHGPPGTGKTSLCKALAQKLAIRFSHRFARGQLIEVNAHSLFSKWFSESGKLVTALFARIREVIEEEDTLVFVLVDEVESLTSARKAAVSGSEPADAVRAVNALLTALDSLKAYPNVMLLTTSNITEAIDEAFLDRVDIKIRLGPPDMQARYEILRGCVMELQRAGVVSNSCAGPPQLKELRPAFLAASEAAGSGKSRQGSVCSSTAEQAAGERLRAVASVCEGMSGRLLRKLPFLAHIALMTCEAAALQQSSQLPQYLAALHRAALQEKVSRQLEETQ